MAIQFDYDTGAFRLGGYARAPITVHASFFLLAGLLSFPFWRQISLRGFILTAIFVAVVFASVLVHELAHAAAARRFHLPVLGIDVYFWGGQVRFGWRPRRAMQDAAITAAGPLSNLVLALLAYGLLQLCPKVDPSLAAYELPGILTVSLKAAAWLNAGLFVVNMLPAFPLDGGRLLYLLVSSHGDVRAATLIVSGLGALFGLAAVMLLVGTSIAGMPIWSPPSLMVNGAIFRNALRRPLTWDAALAWPQTS